MKRQLTLFDVLETKRRKDEESTSEKTKTQTEDAGQSDIFSVETKKSSKYSITQYNYLKVFSNYSITYIFPFLH